MPVTTERPNCAHCAPADCSDRCTSSATSADCARPPSTEPTPARRFVSVKLACLVRASLEMAHDQHNSLGLVGELDSKLELWHSTSGRHAAYDDTRSGPSWGWR